MDLHEFIFKKLNDNRSYFIAFHDMHVSISHSVPIQGTRYSTELIINKLDYFNDDAKWTKLNRTINDFMRQSKRIELYLENSI